MPVKLRRLRYLIDQGEDGRIIFPDAEITQGVITSGGSLRYGSGSDIQTQIEQWVTQEKKVHKTADGKSRVPTDDQGYPSVTYVNTRKAVAEVDDDTIVKSLVIKYLEPYAMKNLEAIRAAVKRLNKLYDLGITVKSSWTPPLEEEEDF